MNAPNRKSWRDVLSVHPAADLFPMMTEAELKMLGEDIRKNGLQTRIVLFKDEKHSNVQLLDGRNRLRALEIVGFQVEAEQTGTDSDPDVRLWVRRPGGMGIQIETDKIRGDQINGGPNAAVVSLNIHRRHLTVEQKRDLAAKLIKADPGKSDRQIAETVKVSPTTVGSVRAEMEKSGDVSKLDTRADSKGRQQPARKDRRRWNDGGAQTKRNAKRAGMSARPPRDHEDSPEAVARRKHDAFLIAANEARAFAQYDGPISEPIIESALRTAAIWQALADRLQAAAGGLK